VIGNGLRERRKKEFKDQKQITHLSSKAIFSEASSKPRNVVLIISTKKSG
jgi:hypothetical protein